MLSVDSIWNVYQVVDIDTTALMTRNLRTSRSSCFVAYLAANISFLVQRTSLAQGQEFVRLIYIIFLGCKSARFQNGLKAMAVNSAVSGDV
jgi:hypothetical protein